MWGKRGLRLNLAPALKALQCPHLNYDKILPVEDLLSGGTEEDPKKSTQKAEGPRCHFVPAVCICGGLLKAAPCSFLVPGQEIIFKAILEPQSHIVPNLSNSKGNSFSCSRSQEAEADRLRLVGRGWPHCLSGVLCCPRHKPASSCIICS